MSQERSPSFPTFVAYGPRMDADRFGQFELWCQLFCSREIKIGFEPQGYFESLTREPPPATGAAFQKPASHQPRD
jgi:hypothetical protein